MAVKIISPSPIIVKLASVPALCEGEIWIKQYISIATIHSSVLYVYIGVHSSTFSVLTMQ